MGSAGGQLVVGDQPNAEMGLRGWLALATGLNLAFAICSFVCKAPETGTLTLQTRLLTAVLYLMVACLAGGLGMWIMLGRQLRGQFGRLARCGLRGWVFLPAMTLFLQRQSVWAPCIAMVSAALMADYLCRFTKAVSGRVLAAHQGYGERGIFTMEVHVAPASWVPFVLSLSAYGAVISGVAGRLVLATVLIGSGAFLLVLQLTAARMEREQGRDGYDQVRFADRRSQPYGLIVVAFWCAFLALSVPSHASWAHFPGWGWAHAGPALAKEKAPEDQASSGYHLIVLWPIQKQEKVIRTPPLKTDVSSSGTAKPWVIPFYGPYWYFKLRGESPGPTTRTTQGDPLKVNVRSTDRSPLLMEAHQHLVDPIDLTCCREIQVVLRNDAAFGALAVSLALGDSSLPGKLPQNLGVQYAASDAAGQRSGNTLPVEETLIFLLPRHELAGKFDELTVTLLPEAKHLTSARKVAVERFIMIPN